MLYLLLACARPVPPALQIEPATVAVDDAEPTDPAAQMTWMMGSDPLVRRVRVPTHTAPAPVRAWLGVATMDAPRAEDWWALERANGGTIAVVLARGARLAALETRLGDLEGALDYVLPLPRSPTTTPQDALPPLAWLGTSAPEALLTVVERSTLLGWLDAPSIDVGPCGALLGRAEWARLAATPAGTLLVARAERRHDAERGAAGLADLSLATAIALEEVSAVGPTERAAVEKQRAALGASLGAADRPIVALVGRAQAALVADAGSDTSAGAAILALTARRWWGACEDPPCGGFDRAATLATVARWGETPAALAAIWRVILLQDARDHVDAAYTRATFPQALAELLEVLAGFDPTAALDRGLLRRARPDPTVHLLVGRAADHRDSTDPRAMFEALDALLAREIAAARPHADARQGAALDRMANRLRH
jgi:hypothetical protein